MKILIIILSAMAGATIGYFACALMVIANDRKQLKELRQDLRDYGRHAEGCSAAFGDYKCKCGWDKVKESNK